jgi:adenylate cyclase
MESIAQLQLAGVSNQDDVYICDGTSEVRLIRRTFENMKKAIKSWGKYVPWPVVQLLLRANVEANLEVNELEVTVFFSDIASFTTIVEGIPPESSLLLLSRYFNDMSKIIDDHGGVVLEFIGDAILCVFGAPLNNPEHPTAAVKASLRMLSCLRRMNEWSKEKHLPEVNIRCGVHTGRVLVGNMGFHSRMKYGIVGEESHVPDKLEELNKTYGTSMLISAQTFAAMDRTCFVTRPVDYIRIVPTAGSSLIYQVVDRHKRRREQHPLWPACDLHQQAMEHYRKREFQEAKQKFHKVGEIMASITGKEDGASALLAKRSDVYSRRPPPDDWDGVWTEEKH